MYIKKSYEDLEGSGSPDQSILWKNSYGNQHPPNQIIPRTPVGNISRPTHASDWYFFLHIYMYSIYLVEI